MKKRQQPKSREERHEAVVEASHAIAQRASDLYERFDETGDYEALAEALEIIARLSLPRSQGGGK